MVSKIKLDLFKLKPKDDLIGVYKFFKKQSEKWFNKSFEPKAEYFFVTNCPLCSSDESNEVYKVDGFSYHECQSCDSLYTKPNLRQEVLESLYSDGTYQVYQDSLVKTSLDLRKGILQVLSALKKGIIDDVKISYIKHQYDPGVLLLEKELLRIGGNFREVNQQSYSIKVESELIDELNEIQIFLQSYESLDSTVDMPLLILEALACGCSVVTNIEFEELNHPQLLIDFNGIKHSNLASNKIQSGVLRSKSSKAIHDKFNILAARDRIMEFFDEKNIS